MVVAAPAPQRVAQHAAIGVHEPLVGVHEARAAERGPQDRELVGPPAVVLVAQRDQARPRRAPAAARARSCGRSPAAPARGERGSADRRRATAADPREVLGRRRVVGDTQTQSLLGLRAQRLDLGAEQRRIRLEAWPCRPRSAPAAPAARAAARRLAAAPPGCGPARSRPRERRARRRGSAGATATVAQKRSRPARCRLRACRRRDRPARRRGARAGDEERGLGARRQRGRAAASRGSRATSAGTYPPPRWRRPARGPRRLPRRRAAQLAALARAARRGARRRRRGAAPRLPRPAQARASATSPGTSTVSVGAMPDGTVMSRELRGEARRMRAAGLDWPLQGLTMVGLDAARRPPALRRVGRRRRRRGRPDRGRRLARRRVDADARDARLARRRRARSGSPTRSRAFPRDERRSSAYDFLAAPLEDVQASFARLGLDARRRASCPGFFEATLPPLAGGRWAIVRLDADTYEPTRLALALPLPRAGAGRLPGARRLRLVPRAAARAVDEFRARARHHRADRARSTRPASRWRRESADRRSRSTVQRRVASPRAVARAPSTHVPTEREVELARAPSWRGAEAAIGLRPWLRRKLRATMIVFASSITDPEIYRQRRASRASGSRRRARLRGPRQRCGRARSSAPTT